MKSIYKIILPAFFLQGIFMQTASAQSTKTNFEVEIKNSIGKPQKDVFIKISGKSDIYRPDSCGVIKFEYSIPKNYKRTANIHFNTDKDKPIRSFILEPGNSNLSFTIDTSEDLVGFKKENNTFAIEGIVTDEEGKPIEGAVVSIQGTGRQTLTDEIGLFSIDADYNHNIIIRADGMENLSLGVTPFLAQPDEAYCITMNRKSEDKIYSIVEKRPQYPGGMGSFKKYIERNLIYPEQAKKDSIEGVVVMQFVVEKNGEITSPKVVRTLEPSLDSIAVQLIKSMPKWNPGSDYGTIVRCKQSVPIAFKIPIPKPSGEDNNLLAANLKKAYTDSIAAKRLKPSSFVVPQRPINPDSVTVSVIQEMPKAKKRNAFVRFFRRLFGIND